MDGIDNPGTDDIETIKGNSALAFFTREGMNTFYLGFNNTLEPWDDENVRKGIALGINREQIVENFYPEGSEVATHFTPCSVPFGCEGDAWWDFNAAEGKQLLEQAGFDFSKTYKLQFRAAVRGYLPDPPQIATEIQGQLRDNLGIETTLDLQESGAFLDANAAGTLDGTSCWAGAPTIRSDQLPRLPLRLGLGRQVRQPFDDVVAALNAGATTLDEASRQAAYEEANNLIKQHVPAVIIAHGASGTAFKADVDGAHSSPLGTEIFAAMQAAIATRSSGCRTLSRSACSAPTRPTARRSAGVRADLRVALRLRAGRHRSRPVARRGRASPTTTRRPGPARCATASSSMTAPTSTPTTSWSATRRSGMPSIRSTSAGRVPSSTSPACGVATSTRRRRRHRNGGGSAAEQHERGRRSRGAPV